MKCCRFFVLFVAILFLVESTFSASERKKRKYDAIAVEHPLPPTLDGFKGCPHQAPGSSPVEPKKRRCGALPIKPSVLKAIIPKPPPKPGSLGTTTVKPKSANYDDSIKVVPTGIECDTRGTKYLVQYEKKRTKAIKEIVIAYEVCHDAERDHTIYAHGIILPASKDEHEDVQRPCFTKNFLYTGVQMTKKYTKIEQQKTLGKNILGDERLADKYYKGGEYYLAKGHLIAMADLVGKSNQRATFAYANTVPMWQIVNNGNWKKMELKVRDLATKRNIELNVWVGSIGILTFKDKDKNPQEFYLHVEGNVRKVPVPKLLFKVVYHEKNKSGVVFITLNDPFAEQLTKDVRICTDVCERITYLKWDPTPTTKGLSYCCEIDDFRQHSPVKIPPFKTMSLLT